MTHGGLFDISLTTSAAPFALDHRNGQKTAIGFEPSFHYGRFRQGSNLTNLTLKSTELENCELRIGEDVLFRPKWVRIRVGAQGFWEPKPFPESWEARWRPHAPDLIWPSSSGLAGRSDDGDRRNTLCSPFAKFQLKVQDNLDSRALIE